MLRLNTYLRVTVRSFKVRWDLPGQLYEIIVKQRDAHLRRGRHAHLVGVGQVKARQERLEIEIQKLIEPMLIFDAVKVLRW